MRRIFKLIASIVICQLTGILGSFFTRSSVDTWYKILQKPFFTPPSWVFAPVWIILYMAMGFSLFLIWDRGLNKPRVRNALSLFLLQLIINSSWSIAFFGMQNISLSVFIIIVLWIAIFWTIMKFYKISKLAALILMPYIFWVSFAAILNTAILFLNS